MFFFYILIARLSVNANGHKHERLSAVSVLVCLCIEWKEPPLSALHLQCDSHERSNQRIFIANPKLMRLLMSRPPLKQPQSNDWSNYSIRIQMIDRILTQWIANLLLWILFVFVFNSFHIKSNENAPERHITNDIYIHIIELTYGMV